MDQENTQTAKSVTGGIIIMYLIGIAFMISGLLIMNIPLIIAAAIILPITNTLSKKYLNVNFSGPARVVIAIIVMIIGTAILIEQDTIVEESPIESVGTAAPVVSQPNFELGTYKVESEEFKYINPKELNLFRSYNDRTVVGKLKQGDIVEVTEHQLTGSLDYCLVKYKNLQGWTACGWLVKVN